MWRVGTLENPDPDDLPEGAESVVIPVRDKQAGDEITYVLTDIAEQTRYTDGHRRRRSLGQSF